MRLQKHAFGFHQSLADGAAGRLPEVAALRVLEMRASRDEREADIRHRRAGQHAGVRALKDVGEDEPLPVEREVIRR